MDPSEPRIEIFAPFGAAFELTRQILFRPFRLTKWLVIGFAAWLATFSSGLSFNYQRNAEKLNLRWKAQHGGTFVSIHDLPAWVIPAAIVVVLLLIAIIVLLAWLNARGRFIFTDCIVHDRAAIVAPWREFRREGNRYFLFQICVTFCNLLVFAGLFALMALAWYWNRPVLPIALLIFFGVVYFLVALVVLLLMKLMVPVMYRQRCGALDAFAQVWALLLAHPDSFVLFALFYLLLIVASVMIGCLAACFTCCLAALPYIGTVILLPVVMFLFAYPLCFLRQLGDRYDAFAVVRPEDPPPLPAPPVQVEPPPAP